MARNQNKKGKGRLHYCELCKKKKREDVVACDKCDKWFHFRCVNLVTIGKKEIWLCPECKKDTSLQQPTTGSQQNKSNVTIPIRSPHESSIGDSRQRFVQSLMTNESNRFQDFDQQSSLHLSATQTRIHPVPSKGSFGGRASVIRNQIELAKIEEEHELERRYLDKKYSVLLANCRGDSIARETVDTDRKRYTQKWLDTQSQQRVSLWKDDEDKQNFLERLNEIRFENTSPLVNEKRRSDYTPNQRNPEAGSFKQGLEDDKEFVNQMSRWSEQQLKDIQEYSSNQPNILQRNSHDDNQRFESFPQLPRKPLFEKPMFNFENTSTEKPRMFQPKSELVSTSQVPYKSSLPGDDGLLTKQQIASRHVVTKDLPNFYGNPEDWPMLFGRFNNSTKLCGYTDGENLDRLQKCLKGSALEAVRSRLLTSESVKEIMDTLAMLYGRPELIINSLLKKLRQLPPPKSDKLNTMVDFALAVKNVSATIEQSELSSHLGNPILIQELVDRLPTNIKIEWARYKVNIRIVTISTLGKWLYDLAKMISTITEPTIQEKSDFKRDQNSRTKDKHVNVHQEFSSQSTKEATKSTSKEHSGSEFKNGSPCLVCQKKCAHVEFCPTFIAFNVDQRWNEIYQKGLCRKCLGRHNRFCSHKVECGVNGCTFKHHRLLHDVKKHSLENPFKDNSSRKNSSGPNNAQVVTKSANVHNTFDKEVLLKIIPVVLHCKDQFLDTFAYLDDGSDATMINRRIAEFFGIKGTPEPLCLLWTDDIHRNENNSHRISIHISGSQSSTQYCLNGVRTVQNLGLPLQTLIKAELVSKFPYLMDVPFEDYVNANAEILIGLDMATLLQSLEYVEGELNQPIASRTKLGWTIHGPISSRKWSSVTLNPHSVICPYQSHKDEAIHQLVKEFFQLENFGVQIKNQLNLRSKEDERALVILEKFTKHKDNRFETSLLWKYDKFELPSSYEMAKKRLLCLERHKPNIISSINDIINEYITKGYVRKLTEEEKQIKNFKTWYLPLFIAYHPKKPEKLRLVFDAAAKVKGISLNSMLITGPDEMTSMVDILRRFREKRVAFSADIKEMYHQVKVCEEDKHSQRFLWRNGDEGQEPDEYMLEVLPFGLKCLPSIAQFVKNGNADNFVKEHPEAVYSIKRNHYVDDLLDCQHTTEEAVQLYNEISKIHSRGGFQICKFMSNSIEAMEAIGEQNGSQEKSLNRLPTKRELLKILMTIYDPLGLISHYLIHLKIILQDVWRANMSWDESLSKLEIGVAWKSWLEILPNVEQTQIPRVYSLKMTPNPPKTIEYHIFVDASEKAYSAVAFLRVENDDGVDCTLIGSKARVAPLKYLSIPRLELQAGILGSRFLTSIGDSQTFKVNRRIIWSDSSTVLSWIRADHRKYHQFVAHRIGEILDTTNVNEWRYVPSKLNVADDATKWKRTPSFELADRWFTGPDFLKLDEENWPQQPHKFDETIEEMKVHLAHVKLQVKVFINAKRFSNWNRMVRAMAYVKRYIYILRSKVRKEPVVRGHITRDELLWSRQFLFKQAQYECYPEELVILSRNKNLPEDQRCELRKSSPIFNLSPDLDEDGLMRLRGRIDAANIPYDMKRPIILPRDSRITTLLVLNCHQTYNHHNVNTVINELRQQFYIPRIRQVVKSVRKNECQRCKNRDAKPKTPEMGNLPFGRLAVGFRPFSFVGIDYFGPMMVTVGRQSRKRWGVLFTCLTIRAVHIEIAHTLDTNSCIMCIRNFIDIRGAPQEIFSDNGTNFRGMDNELKVLVANLDLEKMATHFSTFYSKWNFNPPESAHMAGSWERMIRTVKVSLYEMMTDRNPSDEMLRNLMMEAMNVVNSHPLTFIPIENEEDEALTPSHFIHGNSNGNKTVIPYEMDGPELRSQWRESQRRTDMFWTRFVKEYLPTIIRRTKWFSSVPPIAVGDIVLIIDKTNPRNVYPRARVLDTVVGSNGQVRKAQVQRADKFIMWRSASGLAKLDVFPKASEGLAEVTQDSETGGSVTNASILNKSTNPTVKRIQPDRKAKSHEE